MRAVVTAPDLRILLGMAEAGAGWTVLPDYLCADALAAGRLAELPTDRAGLAQDRGVPGEEQQSETDARGQSQAW